MHELVEWVNEVEITLILGFALEGELYALKYVSEIVFLAYFYWNTYHWITNQQITKIVFHLHLDVFLQLTILSST